MKRMFACLAAASLLTAPPAQAQDSDVFTPSSVWAADYGEDYCRLIRSFSNGNDEISVVLQRVQPGADTQMMLIGNALRTFRGANQLTWHFLPNDSERKTTFLRSETGDGQQYLRLEGVMFAPPAPPPPGTPFGTFPPYDRAADQGAGASFTGLAIDGGLTKPVRVETGELGPVVGALQACTDDLIQTWGLDAEAHKTLSAPATPQFSPDGWLPTGTIPFSEFAKFAGGGNMVRLMLGTDGKPTSCHVHSPTLSQALNDRICQLLMEKASFTPAKDASGEAIASYWLGSPMFLGPPMPGRR